MAETPESSLGSKTRERRVPQPMVSVIRVGLVVVVVLLVATAGWHHYHDLQFEVRRDALLRESQRAHELLGNPEDWRAWVAARTPENHGGAEFVELIRKYEGVWTGLSSAEREALFRWDNGKLAQSVRLSRPNSLAADPGARIVAQKLMDQSSDLPRELELLLQYDTLSPGPDFSNTTWTVDQPRIFYVSFLALSRVEVLYDMGCPDQAAREALIYLQVAMRLNAPLNSYHAEQACRLEESALQFLIELAVQDHLDPSDLARLSQFRPADPDATIAWLIEWDVASAAQGWAHWKRGTITTGDECLPYTSPAGEGSFWERLTITGENRDWRVGRSGWCDKMAGEFVRSCKRIQDLRAGRSPELFTDDLDLIGYAAGWAKLRTLVWERLLAVTGLRLGEDPSEVMRRYPSVKIETREREWVLKPVEYTLELDRAYEAMMTAPPSHLNAYLRVKR